MARAQELPQHLFVHGDVLHEPVMLDVGVVCLHIDYHHNLRRTRPGQGLQDISVGVQCGAPFPESKGFPVPPGFQHRGQGVPVEYLHGPVKVSGEAVGALSSCDLVFYDDIPQWLGAIALGVEHERGPHFLPRLLPFHAIHAGAGVSGAHLSHSELFDLRPADNQLLKRCYFLLVTSLRRHGKLLLEVRQGAFRCGPVYLIPQFAQKLVREVDGGAHGPKLGAVKLFTSRIVQVDF